MYYRIKYEKGSGICEQSCGSPKIKGSQRFCTADRIEKVGAWFQNCSAPLGENYASLLKEKTVLDGVQADTQKHGWQ
jgi:hypothetical protein